MPRFFRCGITQMIRCLICNMLLVRLKRRNLQYQQMAIGTPIGKPLNIGTAVQPDSFSTLMSKLNNSISNSSAPEPPRQICKHC